MRMRDGRGGRRSGNVEWGGGWMALSAITVH